ncbi:hypothetical protein [Rhodophyticola porphyridii]|uniref:hypothetical protein n=1 Tax=Rhodophyticola porphyridii TaxID=1852017 RepID=UPI0035CF4F8C
MQRDRLITALTGLIGSGLAESITDHFLKIRQDVATQTLERASPGKFVETFVQCLQQISRGTYDASPSIDSYLNTRVENDTALPDGLRFSAGRIARAMYTMRNKRNIAHNGEVDPNNYDLAYLHHAASWIMAELVRSAAGVPMSEAGALIELLQAPVGTLVEEIDGVRLVHADVSTRVELLILLHSHYPDYVSMDDIRSTLSRRSASSIRGRISDLKGEKLIFGDNSTGYRLTAPGHTVAVTEISRIQNA